jgi:hypothetical protein
MLLLDFALVAGTAKERYYFTGFSRCFTRYRRYFRCDFTLSWGAPTCGTSRIGYYRFSIRFATCESARASISAGQAGPDSFNFRVNLDGESLRRIRQS